MGLDLSMELLISKKKKKKTEEKDFFSCKTDEEVLGAEWCEYKDTMSMILGLKLWREREGEKEKSYVRKKRKAVEVVYKRKENIN